MTELVLQCQVPPPGWRCIRGPGHEGPCAAVPEPAAMRFLVFSWVGEAGGGGWHDFSAGFDNETDAVVFAHHHFSIAGWRWHVVDITQGIVRSST